MGNGVYRDFIKCAGLGVGLVLSQLGPAGGVLAIELETSLQDLWQEAAQHNPQVLAARERWHAAQLRVPQASALEDPTVGYMVMGEMLETRLGPQEDVFEVEQMIPFPGKLWQKRRMAVAETQGAQAQLQAVEQEIRLQVAEAYYDLYATEAIVRVVDELLGTLRNLEGIAQARYASKGTSQRDVAKAQAAVSDTLQRRYELRQQRDTRIALLHALLNRTVQLELNIPKRLSMPTLELSLDELLELANQQSPELSQASAMVKREGHARRLAQFEYAPDLSVGFQYVSIGDGMTSSADDGRDAWMVPLRVTVPLWQNRVLPAVREAERNLKASQADLAVARNLTEYGVRSAYLRFTTAKQLLEINENALVPEAELAFRSDQAGYEGGTSDVLDFIDSERTYLNAKVAYYQAQAEVLKSYAALERAVGTVLEQGGAQ